MPSTPTPLASSTPDYRPLSVLVGMAFFMEQLDATIISPAIPDIARAFQVDPLSLNLTMTIYLLCSLAFIPVSGLLASRHGTRTVFQAALALFIVSSAACALSTTMISLTLARALQGLAAAMMVPVGRTAIVHTVKKSHLVEALAWMVTPAMLGPMLGPPLGGLLCAQLSWHWIFLINVPVGLLGLLASTRAMPQLRSPTETAFNLAEWLLCASILALGVLSLERARHAPDIWQVLFMLAVLCGLVLLYARQFRKLANPMLDFRILNFRTFSTGFWGGALVRVGYGALPFLLPLTLQIGLGFTPVQSGWVLLASGAIAFFTKTQTATMLRRWGFRRVLYWNGLMCAVGLAACALFSVPGWSLLAIGIVVSLAGFFRAVQFNALSAVSYAELPSEKVAAATTLNTMGWQLAIMLGISLSALTVRWSAMFSARTAPDSADFSVAFLLGAMFAVAAIPCYLALARHAGEELSGHRVSS